MSLAAARGGPSSALRIPDWAVSGRLARARDLSLSAGA